MVRLSFVISFSLAGRDIDVLPLHLAVEESSVPHLGEQVGPPVTGTGGEVHLECQADGVPAPLLSWVLPDRSVTTSTGPSTITLPSDRGVYRCVASNSAGAASTSVRVHVSSLPPVIQQPREEHLLLSPGRPVYAHCSARGAPPPTLRWRIPDGTLVRPSQFLHGNLFVLTNGTLHIRKVGPKDSGSYECTASNAVGTDKRIVKLKIEGGRVAWGRQRRPRTTTNSVQQWDVTGSSSKRWRRRRVYVLC
uniref:Ig-like domain-containing protein n=1 Tax=Neolamprologus brichardi TaxID=32507 RepID=A0A3Q4HL28_NEOBR